jgi:hypothetical protein
MDHYKTVAPACPAGARISAELFALIEPLCTGKVRELNFSFTTTITETVRCVFCLCPVAPVRPDGACEFNVEVETDEMGIMRAIVTRPHRCAESIRFDEFQRSGDGDFEPEADHL